MTEAKDIVGRLNRFIAARSTQDGAGDCIVRVASVQHGEVLLHVSDLQRAVARIAALRSALAEALDGWADAANYKGDYLRDKHGDVEDIARLRALLGDSE